MKSALTYLLVLAVGIFLGVLGMNYLNSEKSGDELVAEENSLEPQEKEKKKVKPKKTVLETKPSEEIIQDTLPELDSTEVDTLMILDTLSYSEGEEEYLDIVSERLIAQRTVTIQVIQPDSLDTSDLLNLKADSYSKNLVVEFWESPLDLIGYELNRSRLKLFGFNSDELVRINRAYDSEKLNVQIGSSANSVVLILEKSPKFKSIILK
jgi:hypothetical protein